MNYDSYEKVIDTLMYFGEGCELQFVVNFAWKDKNKGRKHYYNEYQYNASSKYPETDRMDLVTIKRVIRSCLMIHIKSSGLKIIINQSMQMSLQKTLEVVSSWIKPTSKVFAEQDGELHVVGKPRIVLPLTNNGTAIGFEPIVIVSNNVDSMGARMMLNDSSTAYDLNVEQVEEFLNIVTKIDYYTAALAVLNSVPFNAEERQTHRSVLDDDGPRRMSMFKKNKKKGGFFDDK